MNAPESAAVIAESAPQQQEQQQTLAGPAAFADRRRLRPRDPGIGDWIAAHLDGDEDTAGR